MCARCCKGLPWPGDGSRQVPVRLHGESAHWLPRTADAVVSVWMPVGRKRSLYSQGEAQPFRSLQAFSSLDEAHQCWEDRLLCSVHLPKASLKTWSQTTLAVMCDRICAFPVCPRQVDTLSEHIQEGRLKTWSWGTRWPHPVSSGSGQAGAADEVSGEDSSYMDEFQVSGFFSKRLAVSRTQGHTPWHGPELECAEHRGA